MPTGADIWITHTDLDEAIARLRRGTEHDLRAALELLEAVRGDEPTAAEWIALEARANAALADLGGSKPTSDLPGGLTPREVEVARLVAEGRSNRDIAETFVLSERTVESHVQHILTKLSFTSRGGDRGLGSPHGPRPRRCLMTRDPFVGRDTESAALDAGLASAWSGHGGLFLARG